MVLGWIILFSLLTSVGAVLGAGLLLLLPRRHLVEVIPHLVSYATGALLGGAFLGLIPDLLEEAHSPAILTWVLVGLLLFFLLEKLIMWRHCHNEVCDFHGAQGPLILCGKALHNLVDGVMVAASFMISVPLGISVGWAIITHETAQDVGDLGVLLDSGYSRVRALFYNLGASLTTVAGALLGYYYISQLRGVLPYVIALGAASFIYIALADLTPNLHRRGGFRPTFLQMLLLVAGIVTIWLIHPQHPH